MALPDDATGLSAVRDCHTYKLFFIIYGNRIFSYILGLHIKIVENVTHLLLVRYQFIIFKLNCFFLYKK